MTEDYKTVHWMQQAQEEEDHQGTTRHNTDEENELLKVAKERFFNAMTEKTDYLNESWHTKWKRYDQIYRGQQWQEYIPEDRSAPVLNFTFAIIQSLLPRLTDNHPEVLLLPRTSPDDGPLAEMLQRIVGDHIWYHNRMHERVIPEAILHLLKYGTSILETRWDSELWDGEGDVAWGVVHPMNFFPDPRSYTIEGMEFCFTRVQKPTEFFIRNWPEKGKLVIEDQDWMDTENLQGRDADPKEPTASLTSYWFRDENGDLCVMYHAGDIVLEIKGGVYGGQKAIYEHNRWPFTKVCDYVADKEFWGTGEIELIEMLQNLINSYEAQIHDNTRLMANSQWLVNKLESGLDETDAWVFDNNPGGIMFTQNGGVERIPGMAIPHHVPQHQDKLVFWFEQILGVYDVVQGRRPEGVRAASAIIALQEAASVRVREKGKALAAGIREMTEMAISLVLENYDEPRTVRISGEHVPTTLNVREALRERVTDMAEEAGLLEETFDSPEGLPDFNLGGAPMGAEQAAEASPAAMGMGPMGGAPMGGAGPMGAPDMGMEGMPLGVDMEAEMAPEPQIPEEEVDRLMTVVKFPSFDVEVKVGPSIPYSQALLYEQSKEFFQLGIIDRQAVLEATNFPGREEILERMEQAEQQAMQAEAMGERTF